MEALNDVVKLISDGGYLAVVGFGLFLAYKLAFTTVISLSVVNVVKKIVNYLQSRHENDEKLMQIAASAGVTWPMTFEQWADVNKKLRDATKG